MDRTYRVRIGAVIPINRLPIHLMRYEAHLSRRVTVVNIVNVVNVVNVFLLHGGTMCATARQMTE